MNYSESVLLAYSELLLFPLRKLTYRIQQSPDFRLFSAKIFISNPTRYWESYFNIELSEFIQTTKTNFVSKELNFLLHEGDQPKLQPKTKTNSS
jgi:hypothetical protein